MPLQHDRNTRSGFPGRVLCYPVRRDDSFSLVYMQGAVDNRLRKAVKPTKLVES